MFGGDVPDAADAAGSLPRDHADHQQDSAHQHDELHHVGPDHRLHAAEVGVDRRNDADHQNPRPRRNPEGVRQQHRGRVEHYAEIEAAGREKQPAADHPYGGGEAVFKVFVDRPQLHIVEEFQENEQHHRQCDHSGQPEQQHRAAVVVSLARHGDVADRTEQRREQRDRDRPPLHPAAGEEVILGVFLFMADPAAERKAQQQIERDHRIVDQVHRSSLSGVQPI